MYLIIYKKKRAIKNAKEIYKKYYKELSKKGIFSTFENTCIQCLLYSKTFMRSKAYMFSKPITANLFGIREWGAMYYFIEIVRIPELLDQYKKNGLPLKKYLKLKNASLKNFFYCFFKIFLGKKEDGFAYIKWKKNFLYNLIYPNIYIYLIVYLFSLIKRKYVKY
jgi:hypothetical protein